jgi:hypothetical protein
MPWGMLTGQNSIPFIDGKAVADRNHRPQWHVKPKRVSCADLRQ